MLKFKHNVLYGKNNFYSHTQRILEVVEDTAKILFSEYIPTITALCDGNHMTGSKHYIGDAADIRTRDIPLLPDNTKITTISIWATMIQEKLGKDFDVIIHKTHIHAEFDKKLD